MSTKSSKKPKLRFQITLSKEAADMWAKLATAELRSGSNMLEALIERAHTRKENTKEEVAA